MKLKDINLLDVGNTIQIVGAIYAGNGKVLLAFFPDERGSVHGLHEPGYPNVGYMAATSTSGHDYASVETLDMDHADWEVFLRQTDIMETEILQKASDGTIAKAIVRKGNRMIAQDVSWQVFRRDGYACRYCGNDKTPLTVDHLVLWENGGPSIVANLLSSCKKCNKTRGNLEYADWLQHPYYKQASKRLSPAQREANAALLPTLDAIPCLVHKPTRRH